jgi:hypothetical protein
MVFKNDTLPYVVDWMGEESGMKNPIPFEGMG